MIATASKNPATTNSNFLIGFFERVTNAVELNYVSSRTTKNRHDDETYDAGI